MNFSDFEQALAKLGRFFLNYLDKEFQLFDNLNEEDYLKFENACLKSSEANPWFTRANIIYSLRQWADVLTEPNLHKWLKPYHDLLQKKQDHTVGVVLAGNLPLVGFHDFLSVIASGKNFLGKLSSSDKYLLPAIADLLIKIEPDYQNRIQFTDGQLHGFDAVIATGSNNSARYFEYYFGKYPHIIRKNRNGIAILNGNEKKLPLLAEDILMYFGLGCRNVSKIYVPEGYKFERLLESMNDFAWISDHNKYRNNYDYNKSILLVNKIPHFDNGLILLKEDAAISSPVSVLYYEYYKDVKKLEQSLEGLTESIQCIVSEDDGNVKNCIAPGQTQKPNLWDYADGIDTMKFLLSLPKK